MKILSRRYAKTSLVYLLVTLISPWASAQSYKYCGMKMYYATANDGAEMPNLAMNIGGTTAQVGAVAGDQAQDDDDQTASEIDAGIAVGGAIINAIGQAKQKSHLMEVYNNIREAVLQKHQQPDSTNAKDLKHTLDLINKKKDPSTGKHYNYTLAQISQAVLDSVRSNSLCNDGNGNLVATDNFRNTVMGYLASPLPPPAPADAPASADNQPATSTSSPPVQTNQKSSACRRWGDFPMPS
jgi:hypothetical protein